MSKSSILRKLLGLSESKLPSRVERSLARQTGMSQAEKSLAKEAQLVDDIAKYKATSSGSDLPPLDANFTNLSSKQSDYINSDLLKGLGAGSAGLAGLNSILSKKESHSMEEPIEDQKLEASVPLEEPAVIQKPLERKIAATSPEIPSASRTSEIPSEISSKEPVDSQLSEFQQMQRDMDEKERNALLLKAAIQFGHSFQGAGPGDTSIPDQQIKSAQDRMKMYQEYKNSEENRKARIETAKENRLARQQNFLLQQQSLKNTKEAKEKEEEKTSSNKETTKISERMTKSGLTGINQQIEDIETLLGKSLEDAKELPGYGRAGSLVPNIISSPEQRAVRQKAQALQNLQISKQYGASQTAGEVARFGKESGSGYFESEEAMLNYLRAIKKAAKNDEKVIMSGAKDKGKEYKERMNVLDEESPQPKQSSESERIQAPDGSIRIIPKSDVDAAIKAGGKRVK